VINHKGISKFDHRHSSNPFHIAVESKRWGLSHPTRVSKLMPLFSSRVVNTKINISDRKWRLFIEPPNICSLSPRFVILSNLSRHFRNFTRAFLSRGRFVASSSHKRARFLRAMVSVAHNGRVQNTVYKARKCGERKEADSICG